MANTSTFALNQKINQLQAQVNTIINDLIPYPIGDVARLNVAQDWTAIQTFNVLPQSAIVPVLDDDLVNKLYVDTAVGVIPTIDQVLGAGDTALAKTQIFASAFNGIQNSLDNSQIILEDTIAIESNTLTRTGMAIITPTANSSYTGSQISLSINDPLVGGAGLTEFVSTTQSQISGGVVGLPNPPFPAPDANFALFVDSATYNPTLVMGKSAPFTNSTSLNIDLNNLTHAQGTGSPAPDNPFTISSNKDLDLLSSAGDINLDTPTGVVNINGVPYPPVVPADTLQQVLTAGNTSTIGFQLNAGAGANTQNATTVILDAQSLITPTALASNTLINTNIEIKDEENTSPNFTTKKTTLTNNNLNYFNRVPFGYTNQLDITLNNPTGTGITHTDNFPTPSPFTIDTNTYIKLKGTDTGAIGYGYGIYIDPATPNLYYELDPIQGAGARVEINNQGAISSVITTSQTFGTLSGSSVFLTNAATQRDMLLNQDFINFSSTTVPALNSIHTIGALIFNDVAGITPVSAQLNTTSLTINNPNQGISTVNAGQATFQKASAGGQLNPGLILNNTNATGSVAMEIYKAKPTAGLAGEQLFIQSVYGKDSANAKNEYTRISHTIRDPTNGAEDGSIEIGAFVNGSYTNFIQLNANDAPVGEVNIFRPIDFIGGSDANSTIKTSGTGSVNLNLDATGSAGAGAIALKTKNGTAGSGGGLLLTGDTLLSPTSGGSSGQHLALTINGVVYKIQLLNP
jgi:hypothetical protein